MRRSRTVLSLLLGLGILAGLAALAGGEVVQHLRAVSLTSLALATAVYAVSWLLRTLRLADLLDGGPGLRRVFEVNIGGYAGNIVLPAKAGDALRAAALHRNGVDLDRSLAAVLFTRIQDLLAVVLILLVFLPAVWTLALPESLYIATGLVVAFLIAFIGLVLMRSQLLHPLFRRAERFLSHRVFTSAVDVGEAMLERVDEYLSFRILLPTMGYSLLIWLLEVGVAVVVADGLGAAVSLPVFFVAVSFGNIAKTVPATPGGVGLYEAAVASVLTVAGVPYPLAFTIALVEHTLKNLFIVLIGSYFLSREGVGITADAVDALQG